MKWKAVVVEDEPPARRRLIRMLGEAGQVEVVAEADTVSDAVKKIREHEPEVVFLDIRIPGGDGFEVLRRLPEVPEVVFVTAYDDFAVRAFESDAVDYLVKPVTAERLADALQKLTRRIEAAHPNEGLAKALASGGGMPPRIVARRRGRAILLDPTAVSHITADQTLVFAWCDGQQMLVPKTLQELDDELTPLGFRRTHRSALVNLNFIATVQPAESGNFILELKDTAHSQVPMSRRRARVLRHEIGI